jgi:hypothetical protein
MKEKDAAWDLSLSAPPGHFSTFLKSIWWDKKGNWDQAHEEIQDLQGPEAAWIHAYLHRKEGDLWNADYWYRRAGKKRPDCSLEEEWSKLKEYFLEKKG